MDNELEKRIEKIECRNNKVTADKAWEVSKTRKLIIFVATYVIVWIFLVWLNAYKPWLSALVPPTAFLLSTLALQKIKIVWVKRYFL
jgi:hypothetical protein